MIRKTRLLHRNFLSIMGMDALLVMAAWYGAHMLRFNFEIPQASMALLTRALPFIVVIKIVTFYFFDLYQGMWRYTSITDLFNIIKASAVSSFLIIVVVLFSHGFAGFARSVFIIDAGLTIVLISSSRLGIRLYFWLGWGDRSLRISPIRFFARSPRSPKDVKRLLIIGAGDGGEKIYREIRDNAHLQYKIVGFIDDDRTKTRMKIHGVPVLGATSEMKAIAARVKADESLIAIPSATSQQMRDIVDHCKECGIPFKTLPGMGELIDGKVTVKAIRDVAYRDLLGREPVHLDEERIGAYLENTRVLVTGAGGSIGSELCRQICRFQPASVILYEGAESPLYDMEVELNSNFPHTKIIPVLADIRDRQELSHAFEAYSPQVVFHAAAYKHVPMLELRSWKAVMNNILGTRNVIDISRKYSVERFVFVSTDKAVRPANIMGATKRVTELLVQGQNDCGKSLIPFMIVRFGNVVGSAGSVVPLFKKQIEKGGPVTVTDREVTRYFMTTPEACQLILQAGAMGEGGEIFVLDMGPPIKIDDMARDLIRLSGFEPDVDIKIEYIGLRPGEKLHEELITEGEGVVRTTHEKIMVLRGTACDQAFLNGKIDELTRLARDQDAEKIKAKLQEIVPEYSPAASRD
ncbi:MAG: polysaccharide biosynthesis protein [Desulfobacterales bacterium]|nr:polysaccharide biosynthesis protein [Desulfobacterales bacterium]